MLVIAAVLGLGLGCVQARLWLRILAAQTEARLGWIALKAIGWLVPVVGLAFWQPWAAICLALAACPAMLIYFYLKGGYRHAGN